MKLVIIGGTGLIGSKLVQNPHAQYFGAELGERSVILPPTRDSARSASRSG